MRIGLRGRWYHVLPCLLIVGKNEFHSFKKNVNFFQGLLVFLLFLNNQQEDQNWLRIVLFILSIQCFVMQLF